MSCTVFTTAFIDARIAAITAQIVSIETAMTSLSSDNVKSYTINDGQTTQTVTKRDMVRLQTWLDQLIGRLQFWDEQKCNRGTIIARSNS